MKREKKHSIRNRGLLIALVISFVLGSLAQAEPTLPTEPAEPTIPQAESVATVAPKAKPVKPAPPPPRPLTPMEQAFADYEGFVFVGLRRLNRDTGYNENRYPEMGRLAELKAELEQKIDQLEKYQSLLTSQGIARDASRTNLDTRITMLKRTLRIAQEDFNKLKRAKDPNYGQDNLDRAEKDVREFLERDFVKEIPRMTQNLTPAQTVEFLEALALGQKTSHRNIVELGERNVLGPDFTQVELERLVSLRALDVLAKWGTKEAWAAIGRIAEKSPSPMIETAAVQHLLRADSFEKRQGLDSLPETSFLKGIRKIESDSPLRFVKGRTYIDTSTPEYKPVVFEGMAQNPEFGRARAHDRFAPSVPVDGTKEGLIEATMRPTVPSDRWSRVPRRIREACNLSALAGK